MIVWGQCNDSIRYKLWAYPKYEEVDKGRSLIELVRMLKWICCSLEATTQRTYALAHGGLTLYTLSKT